VIGLSLLIDAGLIVLLTETDGLLRKGLSFVVFAICLRRFYCNFCIGVLFWAIDACLCSLGDDGEFCEIYDWIAFIGEGELYCDFDLFYFEIDLNDLIVCLGMISFLANGWI